MSEEKPGRTPRRYRGGLFWPVILIAAGLMFLLSNLGVMTGDLWESFLSLWPILLILIGVDSLIRREGIVSATLWIALGIIFLLSNFGYLYLNVWGMVIRVWPLFLVAVGLDILFRRRTLLLSLLGAVMILAILVGTLWGMGLMAAQGAAVQGVEIRQDLEGATSARVLLDQAVGSLGLKKLQEPVALVMGTLSENERVKQVFSIQNGKATYNLRSIGGSYTYPGNTKSYAWNLGLTTEVPINLDVSMGVGEVDLDLTGVNLSALKVGLGVGEATITLSGNSSYEAQIDGAIGQLVIIVPKGVGVRISTSMGIASSEFPPGYINHTSPNYDSAENKIQLKVDLAIGSVVVQEQ
jgi:hypothetical protein